MHEDIRQFSVSIKRNGVAESATITLERQSNGWILFTYVDSELTFVDVDPHVFSMFKKLRKQLESDDTLLLCKGCRFDVYPSGRMLSTVFAFQLKQGRRVDPDKDKVMIFDLEPDETSLCSVNEQTENYQKWLNSISSLPYDLE
jgi:hypothetical protein